MLNARALLPLTALLGALAAPATANEFEPQLRALAASDIAALASAPEIVEAVRAQNADLGQVDPAEIQSLDAEWRAQLENTSRPMIAEILARPGSEWLRTQAEQASGLFTEIFVTDSNGLNVVQSSVTSDYWQGDEAKWTEVYGKADGTTHLGEIEFDESTQTYQAQVSVPIQDPETGAPLGAITVGVNLALLN